MIKLSAVTSSPQSRWHRSPCDAAAPIHPGCTHLSRGTGNDPFFNHCKGVRETPMQVSRPAELTVLRISQDFSCKLKSTSVAGPRKLLFPLFPRCCVAAGCPPSWRQAGSCARPASHSWTSRDGAKAWGWKTCARATHLCCTCFAVQG